MREAEREEGLAPVTLVIAHRGASLREKENTMAAFRAAAEMGANWVELDVRLSRDGVPVVVHDPRLGDGRRVAETVVSDLPEYVPSLSAVLEEFPDLGLEIELKYEQSEADGRTPRDLAEAVTTVVAAMPRRGPMALTSFDAEVLAHVRDLAPNLRTGRVTHFVEDLDALLRDLGDAGHSLWVPHLAQLDPLSLAKAHELGVEVHVWTVDAPGLIRHFFEMGVDGVITNVPDVALEVLGSSRPPRA